MKLKEIEPELTAEEVLQIARELSFDYIHDYLGCCQGHTREYMLMTIATPKQVIDMCKQWESRPREETAADRDGRYLPDHRDSAGWSQALRTRGGHQARPGSTVWRR